MGKNLTKREKFLVSMLVAIIVIYGYGQMIFMPKFDSYSQSKEELKQNKLLLEAIKDGIKDREELKRITRELELQVGELEESIPPIMYQEEIIVMIKRLFEQNGVNVGSISYSVGRADSQLEKRESSIEEILDAYTSFLENGTEFDVKQYKSDSKPKQESTQDGENQEELQDDKYYSMGISLSVSADYSKLRDLLAAIESNNRMIILKNVSVSGGTKDNNGQQVSMSLNMELPFYYDSESKRIKPWDIDIPKGNSNPYIYSTVASSQGTSSNGSSGASSSSLRQKADFYMILKPITSDMATVTISQNGYRYKSLYIDNENVENMSLSVKKENGKYYFRYGNQSRSYPGGDSYEEFKVSGGKINFDVFSQSRLSDVDFAGANLSVDNQSGLELVINLYDDDSDRPRFKHSVQSGQVSVLKKNL